jgi:zinc protease
VEGSETSIQGITQNDLKSYYSGLISKNKLYVVIVGNIPEADIKAKISMLKGIPLGSSAVSMNDRKPDFSKSSLYKEERKLATNYIQGTMDAPAPGTPDYVAMKIAVQLLSERLFVEIRTKRNLSYAPYAYLPSLKNSYANMYVSTTEPATAVQVMIDEVKKLRKEGFNEKELTNKKEGYLTSYYMNLETNAALNGTLGNNENLSTWKNSMKILEDVQKLKLEDINTVFKKYSNAIRWVYLGDTSQADEKIFNQSLN